MTHAELHKQVSIFLPLAEWRALRAEAARRGLPITELIRQWIAPQLEELRTRSNGGNEGPDPPTA